MNRIVQRLGRSARDVDPFTVTFRLSTLQAGVWPTLLVCAYCTVYAIQTWEQPHRIALVVLFALGAASAVAIALAPMDRLLRGRWCEPFFLSWSRASSR